MAASSVRVSTYCATCWRTAAEGAKRNVRASTMLRRFSPVAQGHAKNLICDDDVSREFNVE
jgi:hypothetical protein